MAPCKVPHGVCFALEMALVMFGRKSSLKDHDSAMVTTYTQLDPLDQQFRVKAGNLSAIWQALR